MERMNRRSSLYLLVFLFFYGLQLDAASVNKDLEGIKRKIERERQGINQVRKREGSVLQALGKIERDLEKKTKDLNTANSKLASILGAMQQKETEAQRLRISLDQRRELLMKRAVALYRWHRGGDPFVLLSGEVPLGVLLQRKHYLEATVFFDRDLVGSSPRSRIQSARLQKRKSSSWQVFGKRKKVACEPSRS